MKIESTSWLRWSTWIQKEIEQKLPSFFALFRHLIKRKESLLQLFSLLLPSLLLIHLVHLFFEIEKEKKECHSLMVFQQLAETPSLDRLSQFCFLEGDRRSLEPFLWHKETRERYNFLLNNRLHFEEKSAREEISYKELLLESKVEVSKKELLSLISLFERRGVSKIDSFSLKPLEEKDRYQLTLRLLERKRCL